MCCDKFQISIKLANDNDVFVDRLKWSKKSTYICVNETIRTRSLIGSFDNLNVTVNLQGVRQTLIVFDDDGTYDEGRTQWSRYFNHLRCNQNALKTLRYINLIPPQKSPLELRKNNFGNHEEKTKWKGKLWCRETSIDINLKNYYFH